LDERDFGERGLVGPEETTKQVERGAGLKIGLCPDVVDVRRGGIDKRARYMMLVRNVRQS